MALLRAAAVDVARICNAVDVALIIHTVAVIRMDDSWRRWWVCNASTGGSGMAPPLRRALYKTWPAELVPVTYANRRICVADLTNRKFLRRRGT